MKKLLAVGVICLFLGLAVAPCITALNYNRNSVQMNFQRIMNAVSPMSRHQSSIQYPYDVLHKGFVAEDIDYEDACFKGTTFWRPFEWWYFDAVFDNNYSVEFHINLCTTEKVGIVVSMVNIYKDGKIKLHTQDVYPFGVFYSSKEEPLTLISDNKKIHGYFTDNGEWIFNISLTMHNASVDLQFTSTTKGWKSKILNMWWWGVIQPKASVNGIIKIQDETIHVNGTGYQEHAWDGAIPFVWGWLWGKFASKTMNIIWTDVFKNPRNHYVMMVLNQDNGGYYNIPCEKIQFSMMNYTFNDGWIIPTSFLFKVEDELAQINIAADALKVGHQASLGTFNYWRYHIHVNGTITFNSTTENIDNVQIMDLTRFW